MKRNLLYKWALAAIMAIMSFTSAFASSYSWMEITGLDQLTAGVTIRIYPYDKGGNYLLALACSGKVSSYWGSAVLTSYEKTSDGDDWTLVDAGSGYYYLKNELGYYWTYQGSYVAYMPCSTSKSDAVKVKLTWDSKYKGVCFWNQTDGRGLNNLYSYNYQYNWYSSPSSYNNGDTNTTFKVYLKKSDAAVELLEVEGIRYRLNWADMTAEVYATNGNKYNNIEIPEYVVYNNKRFVVTSLSDYCFYNRSNVTGITLPNSITSLGSNCFSGCRKLTSITLPSSITSLGNSCFSGCSSLTSITLPSSITSLGNSCFSGCSSLTSITLPSSITLLESSCFSGCNSLTSITLPNSVKSMEDSCFYGCNKLSYIEIPSTLQKIGENIFKNAMQEKTIVCAAVTPPNYNGVDSTFIDSNTSLFVLDNSIDKYKNTAPWNAARSIQAICTLPKEVFVVKTDSIKLDPAVNVSNYKFEDLKWKSNNTDVASVDKISGVITANKVGDAVITVTDGYSVTASATVHVMPVIASSLSITEKLNIHCNKTENIESTILPREADNKTLEWSSDNENVATVDKNGAVKGVNAGTANIIAKTTDGSNLSDTCKVKVDHVVINLSTNTITLQKGEKYVEQTATVLPDSYEHKDVVWSASGNGVASVDAKGNITAIKPGVDTIRCSLSYDSNIYSECCVIVYDENVVYVGGLYYILHNENTSDRWATVTSIYGGKNTSLDAANVAQYYSGTISIPETIIYDGTKYTVKKVGSYAFNCQNDLQSLYVPRTVTEIEPNAAIKAEKLNRVNVADESQLVNIGEEAFKWCTGLKRFTFDGTSLSMASIDKAAFRECTALERFVWTGNTSVKTIGHSAFYGCTALEQVLWKAKSELQTIQDYAFFKCSVLNNFAMPNTTLSVGNSAFRYNAGLTDIQLSTSLNYIDEYAFGECGFSGITLPESLANIQAGAFINNEHLLAIILPERLQGLGSAAFENNSALQSVTFHTAIETMTIGNNAFNKCPVLNKVFITNMNSFAQTNFSNAKANPANTSQHIYDANGAEITKVVLPKGTKYVNNNAFNGCAYIESIEMPSTMDHVNDDIFMGCSALKDVYCYATEVPEFIGVNDPSSMNDVFNRATLHVPYGSESLYKNDTDWWGKFAMIAGCDPEPTTVVEKIELSTRTVNVKAGENYNEQKLTIYPEDAANVRIKYSTANRNVAEIDENGVIKGVAPGVTTIYYTANDGGAVTAECKVIVRDTEVEYVGDLYYLFDTGKKEATVTSIYGGKNKSLDAENVAQVYNGTVNIPEQTTFNAVTYDVKKVGSYAFTCQNDLQALRIGAFVDEIEDNAVTNAINLNRVTVANASLLKTIGKRSFMDCTGLQHVLFEGTTLQMEAINTAAFKNCTKLEDVIWEGKNTMTLIGDSAFYCDGKLETVKWNDQSNLKVIDSYAFYKCASLNHFIMPNSTQSVGKYAFRYNEGLTDIQLSASLSIIYDYAFGECGFSQITLPESLKSVQAGAFINNSYLAGITIPKDMEGIGAGAFENCSALASVTFKTHTTKLTVDKNAFNYCPVLSKVNIDHLDGFAQINFQNAEANPAYTAHRIYLNDVEIVDVELPTGTKYIGNNVFNGCTNIRTLKVPATVEHINDNIFANCSQLKDVYCYATKVPDFIGVEDPSTMSDVFNQATLHVIYGYEPAYKADSWWGRFYNVEGCDNPDAEDVRVTSITISQENVTLKPDDTIQLEATVYPTNATNKKVKWSSSNDDVAMVTDEGFVLAVAEGEADITVEAVDSTEIKAVCHIKVESEKAPVVPIVEIKFEESAATVGIGDTKQLVVTYNPENASNKTLTWTSAKPAVATVDEEGVVTGVSEGKTIITAKTTDGSNLSTNCVVTVTKATGIGSITIGDVKIVIKDRHLTVEGLADDDVITVVNTIGFTVYHGTSHEVDLNAEGIYIVNVHGKKIKIAVK